MSDDLVKGETLGYGSVAEVDISLALKRVARQARAQAFREAAEFVGKWREKERQEMRMEANAFGGFVQSHFAAMAEQAEKDQA